VSQIKRNGGWVSKYQRGGRQVWVPGGPWPTKKEAMAAEMAHRETFESDTTCQDFAKRWLAEWPRKSVATRRLYADAAGRFADQFGDRDLADVDRAEARSWALTIPRNYSKIIGTMYQDAYDVGLVRHNPFSNLRLPATEKTEEIAPPSQDEYRQLMAACMVLGPYAEEFRALIQLTAWTGIRASEVMALKADDFEDRYLNVRRARKDDGTYGMPKNGKERRIALPLEARVQDRLVKWEGSDFAFHTPRGKPFKKGSLYYTWNKVRDASGTSMARIADGLAPIRFHDLRHHAATQWLERGATHFDVSVLLGHEDGGQLVMSRYGHPSKDAATERLLLLSEGIEAETGSRLVADGGG
jgi:integrase